jgi:TonB family protein
MDYAEDSCALRRTFGNGDRLIVWELREFAPGSSFYVTVVGKGIEANASGSVHAVFDPAPKEDRREQDVRFVSYDNGLKGFTYETSLTPRNDHQESSSKEGQASQPTEAERNARERAVTGYTVSRGFAKPITLQTGELHAPMEAMRQCLDELLTHWGVNAAVQKTLSRRAQPLRQSEWAGKIQEFYPPSALTKGESGLVRVRMNVDAAGRPSSCHIQMRAKEDTFERAACERLMQYAKFEPALDASGSPVASYYVTTIYYLLK